MAEDLRSIRGSRRHEVVVHRKSSTCPVVQDEAVFPQHEPVAYLADREGRESIDVDAVEEEGGIRPLNIDLA